MADKSKIEWTDATWNPIAGCSVVSPGCTNCYAMRSVAPRLSANPATPHYHGTVTKSKAGYVWTGKIGIASEKVLTQPLRWRRPRRIFVNSTSDLFHEGVPDGIIDDIFAIMAICQQHTFQVLTKRPERMRDYLARSPADLLYRIGHRAAWFMDDGDAWHDAIVDAGLPLPNVWLGVSVEDQTRADERIPLLLDTPAALRWISAEPLLGPLDLEPWLDWPSPLIEMPNGDDWGCIGCEGQPCTNCPHIKAVHICHVLSKDSSGAPEYVLDERRTLDWIVAGGESGPDARPMHPDWVRSLRNQCAAAGVPFNFKQWGNWAIASEDNGHFESNMSTNDAIWLDVDGRQAKPSCNGMREPIGMFRVSKSRAGRLLDGVLHDAFPEPRQ